jgi:hypothetical protein
MIEITRQKFMLHVNIILRVIFFPYFLIYIMTSLTYFPIQQLSILGIFYGQLGLILSNF